MRSAKLFTTVALAAAAICLALVGCSSDDTKPTQNNQNDITNSQYDAVRTEVNNFVDSTLAVFADGLDLTAVGTQTDFGNALYGPSRVDSTQNVNYWNTVFSSDFVASGVNVWIDSVQYRDSNNNPQDFGSGVAALTFVHNWTFSPSDTSGSFDRYVTRGQLDITGVNTNTAVINGSYHQDLNSQFVSVDSTTRHDFSIDANAANVSISRSGGWGTGCPTSGNITVTVDLTYTKDTGSPVSSSWTFDITFDNGTATVDVTVGSETASYTHAFCSTN